AVARERQPSAVALPEREREHAVKALDAVASPRVARLQHDFGVAVREEAVAERLEFAPQLPVVVDAAVERQRQAEGGIDHRLLGVLRQVDDPQAPVRQRDRTLLERTRRIGTTGLE